MSVYHTVQVYDVTILNYGTNWAQSGIYIPLFGSHYQRYKCFSVICLQANQLVSLVLLYDLRVIVAVVVIHQLDIWTCTAQRF